MNLRKITFTLVSIFLIINILQLFLIQTTTNNITGKVTGSMQMCVNYQPELFYPCETTINQSTRTNPFNYTCQLGMDDEDDAQTHVFSYYGDLELSFNTITGYLNFTPTQSNVGVYPLTFTIEDSSDCDNSQDSLSFDFTILDINDPPEYYKTMNNITLVEGSTYRGIYLNNYFRDPDGDELTYTSSIIGPFTITITDYSEIIISSTSCGSGSVIFTGWDPDDASDDTIPPIEITMSCTARPASESSGDSSGSGGGGGGGGMGFYKPCTSEWVCEDWSRCLINNSQYRDCVDIAKCNSNDYLRTYWRNCTYVPHCMNNIQDEDEEGIDCGGKDCEPCQTCYDKILNNQEEEIDCGGPNCPACFNCDDNIKNYDETGIDCGGPICRPCEDHLATPLISKPFIIQLLYLLALIALIIGIKLMSKPLKSIYGRLWFLYHRKHKKEVLLTEPQKIEFLKELVKIELTFKQKSISAYVQTEKLTNQIRFMFEIIIGFQDNLQKSINKINSLNVLKVVRLLLVQQHELMYFLEKHSHITKLELQLNMELFRNLILSIAPTNKDEIKRNVQEIEITQKQNILLLKQELFNSILALEYHQVDLAQEKYLLALKIYNKLSQQEKAQVFTYLNQTFNSIDYFLKYN